MYAYDFNAVVYDGAIYCNECSPIDPNAPSDDIFIFRGITMESAWKSLYPIFADAEWDFYPTCEQCGYVHDYVPLTSYGRIKQAENDDAYFDRFDICDAWYCFASEYHSGQNSKLYRKLSQLSRIGYRPSPMLSSDRLSGNALIIYAHLVKAETGK